MVGIMIMLNNKLSTIEDFKINGVDSLILKHMILIKIYSLKKSMI